MALIDTCWRKLLYAGVAQDRKSPEGRPASEFAEAAIDEEIAAASAAEQPAMMIVLLRGECLSIIAAATLAFVAGAPKAFR
ncbi:hypothetical protein [Erythrobacter sp.]|uniref:hypothetical protein n=1 Tax=Erythrobacter sp. TaxID=1042 RepID=UPI0025F50065|nr:hypothetical protein [Erythrobacter sp.]